MLDTTKNDLKDQQEPLLKNTEGTQESSCQLWSKQHPKQATAAGLLIVGAIIGGFTLLVYFLTKKEYFDAVSLTNDSSHPIYDNSPDLAKIFRPQIVDNAFLTNGEVSFNVTNKNNDYIHWQVTEESSGQKKTCEIKLGTNTDSSSASSTDCTIVAVQKGPCSSYYPLSSSKNYFLCDKQQPYQGASAKQQLRIG